MDSFSLLYNESEHKNGHDFLDIQYVRGSALEVVMQTKLCISAVSELHMRWLAARRLCSALSGSRENCLLDCTRRGKGSLAGKLSCDEASLPLLAQERGERERQEEGGDTL